MKRLFFALLFALPALAGTLTRLDMSEIDDDSIEITSPVWDGSQSGLVLVNRFESSFDRTVAHRVAGGFRNAGIKDQILGPQVDLGEILADTMRSEGRKLGLRMMAPQEAVAPEWVIGGTIRQALVEIQHVGYGSLLFYSTLDVDVTLTKKGAQPVTKRIRPGRFFVMFNGGMGTGDEAQMALEKIILVGAQEILARLNREHIHASALVPMQGKLAALKNIGEHEGDLHAIGLSGVRGGAAAIATMIEKEQDENARTSLVYALTDLGAAPHAPMLMRRYASEDADVRYATLLALDSVGSAEAMAFIRENGPKDKNTAVRRLAERLSAR
ncbi:MAG TPA: HEAT repeat domain-containing protein [Thermoanaerobaculia bacterium]|nr:HEAT repeat domain-containing protein [Thermoanaerobaculia bacterium]